MSQINVNRIKDSNEGAPDFPSGVNVGGITSTVTLGVTNLNPTNLNVSGVVTATTLDGNLLATGTPTLGLGVTINTSGINISGVATAGIVSATTLYGDGTNLTGIALTIAPLNYNPAVLGSELAKTTGIGLTFNQAVKAGSGNVTLSIANAGVAGTVVENFGVGNSVSYSNGDSITITPTSNLDASETYHLSYPSGAFTTIGGDVSYVGTAYTFGTKALAYQLWAWGANYYGSLGQNNNKSYSSPIQIPGTNWNYIGDNGAAVGGIKLDGTLWAWGPNERGALGQNSEIYYSSPVQVGSDTTWSKVDTSWNKNIGAIKTNGTLWMWGNGSNGALGQNTPDNTHYSSPVQVPGTTWAVVRTHNGSLTLATKTDGTLWSWGYGEGGGLGQNQAGAKYSSPVQVPGTTWGVTYDKLSGSDASWVGAVKTDGTLWTWGSNNQGYLGQNNLTKYSSPVQIPGTDWRNIAVSARAMFATKTNGTLWTWGQNYGGALGLNSQTYYSSPVQIPGTTWLRGIQGLREGGGAIKTDGTIWTWGYNENGFGGDNSVARYSSPVQVPGFVASTEIGHVAGGLNGPGKRIFALKEV